MSAFGGKADMSGGVTRRFRPPQAISAADGETLLKSGLDSAEQSEPHLVVIVRERDHETHPAMA